MAYTTVLTMFKSLGRKGLISHRIQGRAFIYSPSISRNEARKQALENVLRQFCNGSPNVSAQQLLSEHDMHLTEVKALQERVDLFGHPGARASANVGIGQRELRLSGAQANWVRVTNSGPTAPRSLFPHAETPMASRAA